MKRKIFVTLLTSAALSGAQAGGAQSDMPQNTNTQPQEQHVIPSPNPTIDDSQTTTIKPGKISGTRIRPANSTTAAPLKKKTTRPKRRRAKSRKD